MEKLMEVKSLKVQNFGCIKNLEMKLTPLHAVIGPNDSGKSTLLRAVRTGMQLLGGYFSSVSEPFNPGLSDNSIISIMTLLNMQIELEYAIHMANQFQMNEIVNCEKGYAPFREQSTVNRPVINSKSFIWQNAWLQRRGLESVSKISPPRMIRPDPDTLRLSGGLIPSSQPIDLQEKGYGLASVLDAMISRNLDGYLSIRKKICELFPPVLDLAYENTNKNEKALGIKLKNGEFVNSQFMSEGMLYYLAYAVQQYLQPASILLIEEPENGLHPSRIKEIMSIIRELSKTTQVLIATHSPLVINEMEPEEVTVLWRDDEKGTQAIPMLKTTNFEQRAKAYALGELWLSYADGISEKKLNPDVK